MATSKRLLVVIVAYRNELQLPTVLDQLTPQLKAGDDVIVVDNSESVTSDLAARHPRIQFIRPGSNLGFCGGNNYGLQIADWARYQAVLLLNPDLFLPGQWIERALKLLFSGEQLQALSGPLLRYDFKAQQVLPIVDSLGIARSRFGRWHDIGSGKAYSDLEPSLPAIWPVQAICGALILLSTRALQAAGGIPLFDEQFFAYKEDVDLGLRLQKAGCKLLIAKELLAYHGRGWKSARREIPFHLRLMSARNDCRVDWKHRSPYLVVSGLKFAYVSLWERWRR
ncbi:glycosyltransferase family 2 protein [Hydrocarboniphaga effusa]|uniref:glycosyltransferase family 2 protein n=1 Tax=Hydrocarboniphaga effusa TaxID=243629 RepID=UPI0031381931